MLHGNPLSLDFLPETAAVAPLATTPAAHFARPANAPNLFPSPMETGAPGNAPEERIPTSETTESLTVAQPIFVVAEIVQTELLDQDQGEEGATAAIGDEVVPAESTTDTIILDVSQDDSLVDELLIRLPIFDAPALGDSAINPPLSDAPTLELSIDLPILDGAPIFDAPVDPELGSTEKRGESALEEPAPEEAPLEEPPGDRGNPDEVPADEYESSLPVGDAPGEFGVQLNARAGLLHLLTGGRGRGRSHAEVAVAASANAASREIRVRSNVAIGKTPRDQGPPGPTIQGGAKVSIERSQRPNTPANENANDASRGGAGEQNSAGKRRVVVEVQGSAKPETTDAAPSESQALGNGPCAEHARDLPSLSDAPWSDDLAASNDAPQTIPPGIDVSVGGAVSGGAASPHDTLQGEGEFSPPPLLTPSPTAGSSAAGLPPTPQASTSQPSDHAPGASAPPPIVSVSPGAEGPPPASAAPVVASPPASASPAAGSGVTNETPAPDAASSSTAANTSNTSVESRLSPTSTPASVVVSSATPAANVESNSVVVVQITTERTQTTVPSRTTFDSQPIATSAPSPQGSDTRETASAAPRVQVTTVTVVTVQVAAPRPPARPGGSPNTTVPGVVVADAAPEVSAPATAPPRSAAPATEWATVPASSQHGATPQVARPTLDLPAAETALADLAEETTPAALETAASEVPVESSSSAHAEVAASPSTAAQKPTSSAGEVMVAAAQVATDLAFASFHAETGPASAWELMADLEALDHAMDALLADLHQMGEQVGRFLAGGGMSPAAAAIMAGVAIAGVVEHGRRRPSARQADDTDNWIWQYSDLLGGAPKSLP